MTDTVYLHYHGPDLARAAALVESHLRVLLGDRQPRESTLLPANFPGARLVGLTIEPANGEEGVASE